MPNLEELNERVAALEARMKRMQWTNALLGVVAGAALWALIYQHFRDKADS
jgi:hypothetical protein